MLLANIFEGYSFDELTNNILNWLLTVGKNILVAIIFLIVGRKFIKWIMKYIAKSFAKSTMEPIVAKFLTSIVKFLLYFTLAVLVIGILGIPTTSFIAALGTAGLTIGLALQGSLSNFAGGVLILIFKPFAIGDYIKEDSHGNEGTVSGIDLFYTKIVTIDNKTVVVPNGTLANSSLTNFTALKMRRIDLTVGISYDSDIKLAKETLAGVIDANEAVLKEKPIDIYVDELAQSQITIGTRTWVKTEDYWTAKWALTESYKNALDAAGIEIPFNQLTVTMKKEDK